MARFHSTLGYAETIETSPGVFIEKITERMCMGDLLRNTRNSGSNEHSTIDEITIDNRFSIVGSPYVFNNVNRLRYIKWQGIKWKIGSISVERPRLILSVRGEYNG